MFNLKRRRSSRIAGVAACAAFFATAGIAGSHYTPAGVTITVNADGSGRFVGTLGGTRNSANTRERLSCTVTRTEITNASGVAARSSVVSCGARDKDNVSVACVSRDEKFAKALDGVSNDSLIEVSFDAAASCTWLWVYESASLERKGV